MSLVGEQYLTVGSADVTRERFAAAGGVDTAQHVPAQSGRGHRGEHRRGVAQ